MRTLHSPPGLPSLFLCFISAACSASSESPSGHDPGSIAPLSSSASGTVFNTGGLPLNLRAEPTTASAIVGTLAPGAKVEIGCQVSGQVVAGNAIWDFIPARNGYVSDAYLKTGHTGFIPGVPKCGEPSSDCDDLGYEGQCQGSVLRWCEGDELHEVDCAADGRSCGYQDQATGYNCLKSSGGGGAGGGGGSGPLYVRGVKLAANQEKWVRHVGEQIVPELRGSRSTRVSKAAYVSWWSLKEGVLDLDNPLAYSNCHFPPDQWIGPVDVCPNPNNAWQVGISAVQAAWRTLADTEALALDVHPDKSIHQILVDAAKAAGYSSSSSVGQTIAASSGRLRLSWLLRDGAVGFEAQYPVVKGECFQTCSSGWEHTCAWCFGSGWPTSAAFAPTRSASEQAVADLEAILSELAP